jgi:hypothetical protein
MNVVVHFNKRKTQFNYSYLDYPHKFTKANINAAVNHYREIMSTARFARLTSAQQESVVCLRRKWETLKYARVYN